jgi:hypothetical protein
MKDSSKLPFLENNKDTVKIEYEMETGLFSQELTYGK